MVLSPSSTNANANANANPNANANANAKRPVRIANASGFFGDRASAFREMVEDGDIDVLTGDYLAEVTMQILAKQQAKKASLGYAASFLAHLAPALPIACAKGVKIVVNAGGLNPSGLATAVHELAAKLDLAKSVRIATIHGDDLRDRLTESVFVSTETGEALPSEPGFVLSANAYLGGWGIARALEAGANIVICPRVTDASLVIGPAAWWHGWKRDDWNRLAGALAAGHVIECGTQATGGNYSRFQELGDGDDDNAPNVLVHPGFPIAEIADDGSSVITKHPNTGGRVTKGTVTAQLVYEIDSPRYLNPDVVLHVETLRVEEVGADRVAIDGVRGSPPPPTTKVAITTHGSFRNQMLFVAVGLDIDAKVAVFERSMRAALERRKLSPTFGATHVELQRIGTARPDAPTQDEASILLRVVATSKNEDDVGRAFSSTLVELALGTYPGLFIVSPPGAANEVAGYCPSSIDQARLQHRVVLPDRITEEDIAPPSVTLVQSAYPPSNDVGGPSEREWEESRSAPLGTICDARSGDKGQNANVGVWTLSEEAYDWLRDAITVARFRELVPEARDLPIDRYELPNLHALNFVVRGLLRGGATATSRFDRQAKALGEYLRSRVVDIPTRLLLST